MFGLVGGTYSKLVKDELRSIDTTLNITRMWSDVDELLKELATSRSFVEELNTILILDTALEGLGTDNKREKKLLTLQNELAIGNSNIKLKFLTKNQNLYGQLRGKMINVHNRLYENFEVYCPTGELNPLTILGFFNGSVEGTKPPSKTKLISKQDFNQDVLGKLEATLVKVDQVISDIETMQENQTNFIEEFRVRLQDFTESKNKE